MLCIQFGLCSNTCCYRTLTAFIGIVFYTLGEKKLAGADLPFSSMPSEKITLTCLCIKHWNCNRSVEMGFS